MRPLQQEVARVGQAVREMTLEPDNAACVNRSNLARGAQVAKAVIELKYHASKMHSMPPFAPQPLLLILSTHGTFFRLYNASQRAVQTDC